MMVFDNIESGGKNQRRFKMFRSVCTYNMSHAYHYKKYSFLSDNNYNIIHHADT